MNEQYFKPQGLFALVMAYEPDSKAPAATVDFSSTITKTAAPSQNTFKTVFKSFGRKTGTTRGEAQMPIAAPLVYPALDNATEQQKKNAFKRGHAWAVEYMDRRAQATFACLQASTIPVPANGSPRPTKTLHHHSHPNPNSCPRRVIHRVASSSRSCPRHRLSVYTTDCYSVGRSALDCSPGLSIRQRDGVRLRARVLARVGLARKDMCRKADLGRRVGA